MTYTRKDNTSFTLGDSVYSVPKEITNWQVQKLAGIVGDALVECSDLANVLFSGVRAVVESAVDAEDAKMKGMELLADFADSPLANNLGGGVGGLLQYAAKSDLFTKLTAILFLKPSESYLPKGEFEKRCDEFQGVPPNQLFSAAKDFFQKKTTLNKNLNSPSPILETKKKKGTTRVTTT